MPLVPLGQQPSITEDACAEDADGTITCTGKTHPISPGKSVLHCYLKLREVPLLHDPPRPHTLKFKPETPTPEPCAAEIGKGVQLTLQYADLTLLLPCPAAPSTAETRCLSCARAEGSTPQP